MFDTCIHRAQDNIVLHCTLNIHVARYVKMRLLIINLFDRHDSMIHSNSKTYSVNPFSATDTDIHSESSLQLNKETLD
jgi:hypothetical protein